MNASGDLASDAGMVALMLYLFNGGVLITLAGLLFSASVIRGPTPRKLGAALFAGCFAPVAFIGVWIGLARAGVDLGHSTDAAILAVVVTLVLMVFAAPVAALVMWVRARPSSATGAR